MEVPRLPVAASRTMILLDPDLDADSHLKRPADSAKRAPAGTAIPRNHRIPSMQTLGRFLRDAQSAVKLRGEVSVLLTSDENMRRLNREFRKKNKTTDVLSFPVDFSDFSKTGRNRAPGKKSRTTASYGAPSESEIAGDLAISIPTARRQAEERGHALGVEIRVLLLHGLLHLAGYDHETDDGEMARREQRLRAKLGLPHGLIERSSEVKREIRR